MQTNKATLAGLPPDGRLATLPPEDGGWAGNLARAISAGAILTLLRLGFSPSDIAALQPPVMPFVFEWRDAA